MRSIEICPLIGTVFSQRQQEKNIFRVDHTCCQTKYNNLREYFDSKEKAESLLLKANIPLETRAEMLDLNQYIELYKALKEIITNER